MSMSKKHYEKIALIMRENSDKRFIVRELGLFFAKDNSRFDMARFLEACYHE